MTKQILKRLNKQGFTLVELLVAMAISGIVMASIGYLSYSQQKSYVAQEQIAAMQQNLRAAMYYMEREVRMAGCDPTQNANSGFITANKNENFLDVNGYIVRFTEDTDPPDGNIAGGNEDIAYSLADNDGDGDNDLERNNNLIAENIDALDFVYLDGASPPVVLDDDGNGNVTTSISQIRSVQVTVVARVGKADPGYIDTKSYSNLQGTTILPAQNDSFRRRRLTTTIKCRNL